MGNLKLRYYGGKIANNDNLEQEIFLKKELAKRGLKKLMFKTVEIFIS